MAFPSSPVNGQSVTLNGVTYQYNSTTRSWKRVAAPLPQLTPTGVTPGTYGDIFFPSFVVDTLGRLTSIQNTSVQLTTINSAYSKANAANNLAQAAFYYANVTTTAAYNQANVATISAQAAYDRANTVGISSGGIKYSATATAPVSANTGDQWYNINTNVLYEYMSDGTSNFWADINSPTFSMSTYDPTPLSRTIQIEQVDLGQNAAITAAFAAANAASTSAYTQAAFNTANTALANANSPSRTTVYAYANGLTSGTTAQIQVPGFKSYVLQQIQTSANAWIRVYSDGASRVLDAGRGMYTDPTAGNGVIAESILTGSGSGSVQNITPGVVGFNLEGTPNNTIYLAVTNTEAFTKNYTIGLTILRLES